MSSKRKDSKGRLLRTGESQRKDGSYEYKYDDLDGVRRSLYSWKLVATDRTPQGKRDKLSLREQEKELEEKLSDGYHIRASMITLSDCIKKYLSIKRFANATYTNYMYYFEKDIENSVLGRKQVIDIRKSDIKQFYSLKSKGGYSNGTIQILHKIIRPSLQLLVDDEVIGRNPADSCCSDYTKTVPRDAMSPIEQQIFFNEILKYHRNGRKYGLLFTIIQETSTRPNEIIGLDWSNVDMRKREIKVNHGIVYRKKNGKMQFYATYGTDKNRERIIPMTDLAYECFKILHAGRLTNKSTLVVDGYSDFVFVSESGTPLYAVSVNKQLYAMVNRYNKATNNDFPIISINTFRHNGCTNMAENEVDIKTMQYIMGHKNPKMILKVYDKLNMDRVKKQMDKMNHKEKRGVLRQMII
ncbi:MAG: site-specific integrase [Ruminococcus sp.]|nr:site-specific integrase [Ruminococcus sp.]